jgi:hypothetical protein
VSQILRSGIFSLGKSILPHYFKEVCPHEVVGITEEQVGVSFKRGAVLVIAKERENERWKCYAGD